MFLLLFLCALNITICAQQSMVQSFSPKTEFVLQRTVNIKDTQCTIRYIMRDEESDLFIEYTYVYFLKIDEFTQKKTIMYEQDADVRYNFADEHKQKLFRRIFEEAALRYAGFDVKNIDLVGRTLCEEDCSISFFPCHLSFALETDQKEKKSEEELSRSLLESCTTSILENYYAFNSPRLFSGDLLMVEAQEIIAFKNYYQ